MSLSKFGLSPFGWGEIGARDFEVFINGSLLIKPDMSHLETFPNFFKPMKTYIPVAWNFEDLEDKILDLLDSEEKRKEIASNGQDFYRSAISNYGMEKFCKWFINQINL